MTTRIKKLGIFGGSFDPPHYGHLHIAFKAWESMGLDRVFFIPLAFPPHDKNHPLASSAHRLMMLKAALNGENWAEVCDFELAHHKKSYTINTLNFFAAAYPGAKLYLIIGMDAVCELNTWFNWREIIKSADILAAERHGDCVIPADIKNLMKKKIFLIDTARLEISSSLIRTILRNRQNPKYLVPEKVIAYMTKHNLYRSSK